MRTEDLAKAVAKSLNEAVKYADCKNFKEMKDLYDWDAKEVKDEIMAIATMLIRDNDANMIILDDGAVEDMTTFDECTYGQFKKMVMASVQ